MKIALLGYGTVGQAFDRLIQDSDNRKENWEVIHILRRPGKALEARMTEWVEDILDDPEVDLVVEVLGGLHPAYELIRASLQKGKHVITANKAVLNAYGEELNKVARENQVALRFSAACGGGIPFLPLLLDMKKTSETQAVGGILNGTTNFILDRMERMELEFAEALNEAQVRGYAEADPSGDIDGTDTLNKIRLASAVGFGIWPLASQVRVEGIRHITGEDIRVFLSRGWHCRLIAKAELKEGKLAVSVEPTLFSADSPEAGILENHNLVWASDRTDQRRVLSGQGAGGIPTATNLIRDIRAVEGGELNMFPSEIHTAETEDRVQKTYVLCLARGQENPWLKSVTRETITQGAREIRFTVPLKVETVHAEVKKLRQAGPCFFAAMEVEI